MKKAFFYLCMAYAAISTIVRGRIAGKITFADILFVPLFFVFILLVARAKRWGLAREFLAVFALIIAFLLIDAAVTGNYPQALVRTSGQAYLFAVFLVFYYFVEADGRLKQLFDVWFLGILALAGISLSGFSLYWLGMKSMYQLHLVETPGDQLPAFLVRVGGLTSPEYLAHILIVAFFLLFHFYRTNRWGLRKITLFAPLLLTLLVTDFFTFTRTFFAWMIPFLAWECFFNKDRGWAKASIGVASISAVLVLWTVLTIWNIFPIRFEHAQELKEMRVTFSTKYSYPRVSDYYPAAVRSIRKNPIWGNGPGHSATGPIFFHGPAKAEEADAHNIILQLWSTRGIFGLILYLAFWGLVIGQPLRKFKGTPMPFHAKMLLAICVGMMLPSFTVDLEDCRHLYVAFGLLAGFSSPRYKTDEISAP